MKDDPLSTNSTAMFVMSPLATLRWRQGRLKLYSPRQPRALVIHPALIPLLVGLVVPRPLSWFIRARSLVPRAERRLALERLIKAGIVEVVSRKTGDGSVWWDPADRARYDTTVLQLLQIAHGFTRSTEERLATDHWGRPLPWLARPVIDFLSQLELSDLVVFEYGGGASTYYWARHCSSVVCVESDATWAKRLRTELGSSARVLYRPDRSSYRNAIRERPRLYDIILIDAAPKFRVGCVASALEHLSPGGMIILDDAPFYPEAAEHLRAADLIEVDLTGYAPLEANLQTTSLFLSRGFNLPRRSARGPAFPFGSPGFDWADLAPD